VRTACRRRGDPKRSSTICCRSFGLRARPSKAGPSRVPHSGERSSKQFPPRCRNCGLLGVSCITPDRLSVSVVIC
jgi:hypothetical protein